MASIKITDLRKSFGNVHAVDGINLEIPDGKFVALLGPSGCGKTTTLRMISGLETPTSGTIHIGDRDLTHASPRDRDIAMVFQDYALYPHMTILENIGYPLKVRGVSSAALNERVGEVAHSLQIGDLLDRRPGQLSGGQQQRAALARAVVHKAQVFLFDEPLSNLDAKLRLEARAFLKYLQKEVDVTAVYVTHDQSEAMALADYIVVMNKGRIMQMGTPMDVYTRPANTFVAAFIGSPPMNLLPCRLDAAAKRLLIDETHTVTIADLNVPKRSEAVHMVGVRPEYVSIETEPTAGTLEAELYVTQPLGGETLVISKVGEHLVTVRLFGEEVPDYPSRIWLRFNSDRIFFYDNDGELLT